MDTTLNYNCPDCDKSNCVYNFPTIKDFAEGGRFSHIQLPLTNNDSLPDEIIEYIFGKYHFNQCKPRHIVNIKQSINDLLNK